MYCPICEGVNVDFRHVLLRDGMLIVEHQKLNGEIFKDEIYPFICNDCSQIFYLGYKDPSEIQDKKS